MVFANWYIFLQVQLEKYRAFQTKDLTTKVEKVALTVTKRAFVNERPAPSIEKDDNILSTTLFGPERCSKHFEKAFEDGVAMFRRV